MMSTNEQTVMGTRNAECIEIKIGDGESSSWQIVKTNAPKDYDGFGTFTVIELSDNERLVLIREEHFVWQTMRYASGNNVWEAQSYLKDAVIDELWKRFAPEQD
jgi:hypothetical protein